MSNDYTFRDDLTVIIGRATKKSDYDRLVENTNELDQRLEGLPYIGAFLPVAGATSITRDGNGRISTMTLTGSPAGVVTVVYDDGNGGRVNYVEFAMTAPETATIRETYSYNGSNEVTGSTRSRS